MGNKDLDQLDMSKVNPEMLGDLTDQLKNALVKIRAGQKDSKVDTETTDEGIAQLDGLKNQLAQMVEVQFINSLNNMAQRCYSNALAHEFWPKGYSPTSERNAGRNDGESIALIHSELSEWLEALRRPSAQESAKIPGFSEAEEEAADVIIRVLDYAAGRGLRLGEAVIAKYNYNLSRPIKHGKAL